MWRYFQVLKSYLAGRLWIRPAIASLASIAVVAAGIAMGRWFDVPAPIDISEEALKGLLRIFASSMLAVATFSVSAVVTSIATVAGSTTPRATRLVLDDQTTQTVLASFVTGFIFSMISIIAVEVFTFEKTGRLIIFACFVLMVGWVLITFLRWVDHVTKLGQTDTTMDRISSAALDAARPELVGTFGAHPFEGEVPTTAMPITSDDIGFVTRLNVKGLQELAEEFDGRILLHVRPGDFVDDRSAIAHVVNAPVAENRADIVARIRQAVVVSWSRDHHADFRFGLINLAETADRALSPGVNDPGTAIVILGRQLDALSTWHANRQSNEARAVDYDRVALPSITAKDVIQDCFTAIARDGAGAVEVVVRLMKTLQSLVKFGAEDITHEAVAMAKTANELAQQALVSNAHKARVREEAERVIELAGLPVAAS